MTIDVQGAKHHPVGLGALRESGGCPCSRDCPWRRRLPLHEHAAGSGVRLSTCILALNGASPKLFAALTSFGEASSQQGLEERALKTQMKVPSGGARQTALFCFSQTHSTFISYFEVMLARVSGWSCAL